MKATVTIEISDSTSEEKLNKAGFTRHEMAYHYQRAFSEIVRKTLHSGCDATIDCVVTDNTKHQDREIDFDYEAEAD